MFRTRRISLSQPFLDMHVTGVMSITLSVEVSSSFKLEHPCDLSQTLLTVLPCFDTGVGGGQVMHVHGEAYCARCVLWSQRAL